MKQLKSFAAVLLIVALLAGVAMTAQASSSKHYYTVGKVVLRISPGFHENGIAVIPKNTKVKYEGNKCVDKQLISWVKVSYDGLVGWIPAPCASHKKGGITSIGCIEMKAAEPLREKPSTGSKRLHTVKKSMILKYYDMTMDSHGRVWYLVNYKGKIGWVSSKHTVIA